MSKAVSTTSINKVLAASASKKVGMSKSYVTRGYTKLLKDKLPDNRYGSIRIDRLMSKQKLELKKVEEIIEAGREKGIFGEKDSAKKLFKEAQREEKRMAQEEKKIIQTEKKQEAAQKTVKHQDEKASNIAAARLKTERIKSGLEVRLGGKIGQVIEEQNKFRKTWGKSADLIVTSRGGGEIVDKRRGGLVDHAVEEGKGGSASKDGQKTGGNTSANQKSGGQQVVKPQGFVGEKLTHPKENAKGENLPGGVYHVDGLNNKESVSQSETQPAPRSASALEDITDLDIG